MTQIYSHFQHVKDSMDLAPMITAYEQQVFVEAVCSSAEPIRLSVSRRPSPTSLNSVRYAKTQWPSTHRSAKVDVPVIKPSFDAKVFFYRVSESASDHQNTDSNAPEEGFTVKHLTHLGTYGIFRGIRRRQVAIYAGSWAIHLADGREDASRARN
ncbi:hypothetical protein C8R44DRAFT_724019 [Mycena epipterygia]|nr:hypothetical protein C8R44DRAFT_724019 [Mycena epipterygia]